MQRSYGQKKITSPKVATKMRNTIEKIRARARQTLRDTAAQTWARACKFHLPSVTVRENSGQASPFPFPCPIPGSFSRKTFSKQVGGDGASTPSPTAKLIPSSGEISRPGTFDPGTSTRTVSKTYFDNTQCNQWSGLLGSPGRGLF